jgi:hypothetical protein
MEDKMRSDTAMKTVSVAPLLGALACALSFGGCNGVVTTEPGEVQLGLTSAQSYEVARAQAQYRSIVKAVVTIKEIDARIEGQGWVPLTSAPITVDLLSLDHQRLTTLGIGKLPKHHVRALRLQIDQIGAFVVRADGEKKPLEVPDSGKVEVVGDLDLDSCAAGIIILDFDPRLRAERERYRTEYELLPVATLRTEEVHGSCKPDGGGSDGGSSGDGSQCAVVCQPGQICEGTVCVDDPCFNVICPPGLTCHSGACQ